MPAYKIERIPIQVFNFFLPSLSLTEIFALFILDNSLAYSGPPEVLKMFSFFSLDLLDLRAISELLDKPASYHFFSVKRVQIEAVL